MKVLSGHGVCKSLSPNSMDLISMQAQVVNAGLSLSQQMNANLPNTSHTENMNINQRRWKSVFRRVRKKNMNSGHVSVHPKRPLFGQALSDICEKDGYPPKPIMDVLTLLLKKALDIEGVFRKAGNAKTLREIKAQLNDGLKVDFEEQTVFLLADLLKDFLRHIPGSLLIVEYYKSWMDAMELEETDQKCAEVQMLISKLPDPNIQLLKHLIVLLYHMSKNADTNKMDSKNLAVCISPNLLQTEVEKMQKVTILTQFLIDNCSNIFGEDALNIFGDSDEDDLSDNQDSFSSNHHDSAYDSNDPDADGCKGSYSDMESIKPFVEEKPQSSAPVEPWTAKLLTRRRSEPTFVISKGVRLQLALTRSQTEMDFHDKLLTKQISDDCILLRASNSLGNRSGLVSKAQPASKDCSYCSSSSLESCFSSASESSIHNSPPIASLANERKLLQRKHSFPTRQSMPAKNRSETPKRRSHSMKTAYMRSRTVFGRSGSTKKAIERTLSPSMTLPEVMNPQPEPPASFCELRNLSSEEVFQQVDRRIPSDPPSYQQTVQEFPHAVLSNCGSLTVQEARCLQTRSRSTSPRSRKETLDSSSSNEDYDILHTDNKDTCCESIMSRQRSRSETMSEASVPVWCHQENVRETVV